MAEPQRQWQQLFTAALNAHPVVGVRAVVIWHLGRSPTASEITAARYAAHAMESAGRCQLQQVSLSTPKGGRNVLIMARPDLGLTDWPKRAAVVAAARSYPPDFHGTREAVDRMIAALNDAATQLDRIPLGALTSAEAAAAADALGRPLAKLGGIRRQLLRNAR